MIVENCTLIQPISCKKDRKTIDAARMLRDNKQRRLIVVDDEEKPIGIISTTDMNNRVVAQARDPTRCMAGEIMSSPIFLTCDLKDNLNVLYKKMLEHESYFVPVTKQGKLYAVLTYGELKRRAQEKLLE